MPSVSIHIPGVAFWVATGCIIRIGLEALLIDEAACPRPHLKRRANLVLLVDHTCRLRANESMQYYGRLGPLPEGITRYSWDSSWGELLNIVFLATQSRASPAER
jgi:hypothetical protein